MVRWEVGVVNIPNTIRKSLLIAGVGLALSIAGGAKAQEISNTQFADGASTEPFTQPIPASRISQVPEAPVITRAGDNPQGNPHTTQSYPIERIMWIGVALIWVGTALGIYFANLAKRFGPSLPSVGCSQFTINWTK